MKIETVRELQALLRDAETQEREARNRYEIARYKRSALEATISMMQACSDRR